MGIHLNNNGIISDTDNLFLYKIIDQFGLEKDDVPQQLKIDDNKLVEKASKNDKYVNLTKEVQKYMTYNKPEELDDEREIDP